MKNLLASFCLALCLPALASSCPELYPDAQEIVIPGTTELCNSFYVSLYNVKEKRVVLTSERIQHQTGSEKVARTNDFHSDPRVPYASRVTPRDYTNTHFDKGHMAPAADAATPEQMHETFLMTNMTPQEPTLNRESWRILEEKVRSDIALLQAPVWILTVARYEPTGPRLPGSGVPIPYEYWKVVTYGGVIKYYKAQNTPHARVETVEGVEVPLNMWINVLQLQ